MNQIPNTQNRVLEAAADVFAEKGYRDATVQEICQRAEANIAAVNYYFGSKQQLYEEVWRFLWNLAHRDVQTPPDRIADPLAHLRTIVESRIRQLLDTRQRGRLPSIIYREMADPTDFNGQIVAQFMEPAMRTLTGIVAAILGLPADHVTARRCAFNIQSQFMALNIMRQRDAAHPLLRFLELTDPTPAQLDEVTTSFFTFIHGGLQAVKQSLHPS